MRLYLDSKSEKNIGYAPDWLKVSYEKDGNPMVLTLDVQGEIDYTPNTLSCRCKGELIPWVLYDCATGDETDLSTLSEEEIEAMFPNDKIAEILSANDIYEVGIYPVDDRDEIFELAEEDVLSSCEGHIEIYIDENNYFEKDFKFEVELNIY